MSPIIGGLIAVATFFIVGFVYHFVKALKDPDVREASDLHMSITRYKTYKRIWDETQRIYREEGVNNKTNDKVGSFILKEAPNLNEWQRFSKRQEQKGLEEMYSFTDNLD